MFLLSRFRRAFLLITLLILQGSCFTACAKEVKSTGPKIEQADSVEVIALPELGRYYNLKYSKVGSHQYRLHSRWSELSIERGKRRATYNGVQFWLLDAATQSGKNAAISKNDYQCSLNPLLRPQSYLKTAGHKIVVLDPGHGGIDGGAKGTTGILEKNVTLDIAKRVKTYLVKQGHTVHLTRTKDKYLSLEGRSAFAKAKKADVFVSIHLNSSSNAKAKGVESYALTPKGSSSTNGSSKKVVDSCPGHPHGEAGVVLAYVLQKNMLKRSGREDRGVRRASFAVLKNAPCPSALVECGFLSNPTEEKGFKSDSQKEQVAKAVAAGIGNYLGYVKRAHIQDK